jgi:hypothetical protein
VIHAPVHGGWKRAQSRSPGSWSASDAGGGACFGRSLMEKSRSRFETVDLKNSIDPAGGGMEETIHDGEEAGKGGKMQLLIFEGLR